MNDNLININALSEISKIIEHDATSSTYKYVLLRSIIIACEKYEHLIVPDNNKVNIPIGLIVDQWIIDYMVFVFNDIAQQNNRMVLDNPIQLAYDAIFTELNLIDRSDWMYSYNQFKKEYRNPNKSPQLSSLFLTLSKLIAKKLVDMPMKHLGKKDNYYTICEPHITSFGKVTISNEDTFDLNLLVDKFNYFSIKMDHFYIFRYMGQSLFGTSTIISKWKNKTSYLNKDQSIPIDIIDHLTSDCLENRDTTIVRNIIKDDKCTCVWSNKNLSIKGLDIDHVLPFSIWLNNDLWNLLPSDRTINQQTKKDYIPSRLQIMKSSESIMSYWSLYSARYPNLFMSQLKSSLLGNYSNDANVFDKAIESLCKKSDYLINDRGHQPFCL
ncbi:MAG: HNH endonuclease [Candidatus Cloacimonetes bacterium]|nr:HNH endonuclease [Candidatus Cloacimonadota bacterium]